MISLLQSGQSPQQLQAIIALLVHTGTLGEDQSCEKKEKKETGADEQEDAGGSKNQEQGGETMETESASSLEFVSKPTEGIVADGVDVDGGDDGPVSFTQSDRTRAKEWLEKIRKPKRQRKTMKHYTEELNEVLHKVLPDFLILLIHVSVYRGSVRHLKCVCCLGDGLHALKFVRQLSRKSKATLKMCERERRECCQFRQINAANICRRRRSRKSS